MVKLVCAQTEADDGVVWAYFNQDPTKDEWDSAFESDDVPNVEVPVEWEDRCEESSALSKSQGLLRYELGKTK